MGRAARLTEFFELQYLTGQVDTMAVMMTGLESTAMTDQTDVKHGRRKQVRAARAT